MMVLLFLLPLLPGASPSAADLFWGGTAGLTGGVGVALLYRALAVGRMAVVAPTTAVCAVTIPVITDVFFGERLAPLTLFGIGLAMVAIALVSRQRTTASGDPVSAGSGIVPAGIGLALGSGVAIGLFFLALARTHAEAGMWPLLAARAVSVSLFGAMAFVYARPWRMTPAVARIAAAAGVIDMFANGVVSGGHPLRAAQRRCHAVVAVSGKHRRSRACCPWRASQRLAGGRHRVCVRRRVSDRQHELDRSAHPSGLLKAAGSDRGGSAPGGSVPAWRNPPSPLLNLGSHSVLPGVILRRRY